jgi:hypothetical protein
LRAGADALDTAMFPDAETWKLLERSQAFYIPHLYALQAAVGDTAASLDQGTMGWLPQPLLEKLFQLKQERPAAATAVGKQVRLVVASDPGVFRTVKGPRTGGICQTASHNVGNSLRHLIRRNCSGLAIAAL